MWIGQGIRFRSDFPPRGIELQIEPSQETQTRGPVSALVNGTYQYLSMRGLQLWHTLVYISRPMVKLLISSPAEDASSALLDGSDINLELAHRISERQHLCSAFVTDGADGSPIALRRAIALRKAQYAALFCSSIFSPGERDGRCAPAASNMAEITEQASSTPEYQPWRCSAIAPS